MEKNFIDWHTYPKIHLQMTGFWWLGLDYSRKKNRNGDHLTQDDQRSGQNLQAQKNRKNRKVDVEDGTSKRQEGQPHAPKVTHMHLAAKAVQSKLSGSSI